MAYQSDWVSGTISLTTGSAAVTGVGTVWNGAGLQEGDLIIVNNLIGVIASVSGPLALTLTEPWEGPTITNSTYRARYMSDGARYTAVGKQVLQDLQAGNVSALAGLTGTANALPMFTGAGAMTTVPTGATGRAVLAAADQDAAATVGKFVSYNGGVDFAANKVRIGWNTAGNALLAQVDAVQLGVIWTANWAGNNAVTARTQIGAFSSSGGTISGSVTINGNLTVNSTIISTYFVANSAAGVESNFSMSSAFSNRWLISKSNEAETGSNTGSNFTISRWNDAGGYLGVSMAIRRNSGAAYFPETPFCQTNMGADFTVTANTLTGLGTFTFNKGGFTLGGLLNGRNVIHFPLSGWYRITFSVAGNSPTGGATFEVVVNGSNVPAHIGTIGGTFTTLSNTFMLVVNSGDSIAFRPIGGSLSFAGWNTRVVMEFVQPI